MPYNLSRTLTWRLPLAMLAAFIAAAVVAGDSLDSDKRVLLNLKSYLQEQNRVHRGRYARWNLTSDPCDWPGVVCSSSDSNGSSSSLRVTGIDLSDSNISLEIFPEFSSLTELTYLDLSTNTLGGAIPDDLGRCRKLKYLNISHNILESDLNFTGLANLEVLDLSVNRILGEIDSSFPSVCDKLVVFNVSGNQLTGSIDNDYFDRCLNLQYLDLSTNNLTGGLWPGLARVKEFSVSQNNLTGSLSPSIFAGNCSLETLDLSQNNLYGDLPAQVSNCRNLVILNVFGNNFSGMVPEEIGLISSIEALFLGSNRFSRNITESLLKLPKLTFLDLSRNSFGGEIQPIFGKFVPVKFLVLHGNRYTGGISSSRILKLPNVSRLDLSNNSFSGPLPVDISQMPTLRFLILAYNYFNGTIPPEYGNLRGLQALDLSFNRLTGSIPPSLGKLTSLLWLMLANNSLSGEIPKELGSCSSLLWLNLANNQLSGKIPSQLTNIGSNPMPTFELNRQDNDRIIAGSGECLAMKRWIPADYPPFSFIYTILTRKSCRNIWDKILRGIGIFPVCAADSEVRTYEVSGYLQLSGNLLSGEVPSEIGKMVNFSMIHLGLNDFYGELPREIGKLSHVVVLNITENNFSGPIPSEIGNIKCLQNLDLSYNNFSGTFPPSFIELSELSKFNLSYNPLISGLIPSTGQFATFEKESYLGDPLLHLPDFIKNSSDHSWNRKPDKRSKRPKKIVAFLVFLTITLAFVVCGVLSLIVCVLVKTREESPGYLLEDTKERHDFASSSGSSSPWLSDTVKVIRLDKTAFTHADILKATCNFSEEGIIGKGGSGIVYRGVLPDGREVAVKKIQSKGIEGEKEFRAEMEVLSGNGFGWPHPNLVTLHGWCLDKSEKILVYEYMEGGTLEDHISDRVKLTWLRRVDIAIDVARALVFLHLECYPAIVHRDVKASNVLLDKNGRARVTDFGLARVVDAGYTHVSTMVAGTVGYVAPEYGQTWQATTKGDVYSFGVLAMELATGRRAVDGGEECLLDWARRVMGNGRGGLSGRVVIPVALLGSGLAEGAQEMCELLRIGVRCTVEAPNARPNMKEVLGMLIEIYNMKEGSSPPSLRF